MNNVINHEAVIKVIDKKRAERSLTTASKALLQMNQIPAHEDYLVHVSALQCVSGLDTFVLGG